tara:strand:- start:7060 stop:7329 length:270 start_codon:yes stop_codon:yes gene_type:complete
MGEALSCSFLEKQSDGKEKAKPGIILHAVGEYMIVADQEGYMHKVHFARIKLFLNKKQEMRMAQARMLLREWREELACQAAAGTEVTDG